MAGISLDNHDNIGRSYTLDYRDMTGSSLDNHDDIGRRYSLDKEIWLVLVLII